MNRLGHLWSIVATTNETIECCQAQQIVYIEKSFSTGWYCYLWLPYRWIDSVVGGSNVRNRASLLRSVSKSAAAFNSDLYIDDDDDDDVDDDICASSDDEEDPSVDDADEEAEDNDSKDVWPAISMEKLFDHLQVDKEHVNDENSAASVDFANASVSEHRPSIIVEI